MAGNASQPGRSVASKVVGILSVFAAGPEFSLSDIARLTGLPVSTAHRLVAELLAAGLLRRTGNSCYRPGTELKRLASDSPAAAPSLHERARRVLEDLAAACPRASVRLGVLDDLAVAFIAKDDWSRPVSIGFGTVTLPLHATAMGQVLLAFADQEIVDQVIRAPLPSYTKYTITRPAALMRVLAGVRATRVALSRHEFEIDRLDLAVPVFGPGNVVAAALEVGLRRPNEVRLARPALAMAARVLSHELHAMGSRVKVGSDRSR